MGTKISWCEETWNMIGGCSPIAEGCKYCAAATSAQLCVNRGNKKYAGLVENGKWTGKVRLFPDELDKPLHWRKPRRIFVVSMGDLFHEAVPFEFINKVVNRIYHCPQHAFLILTKRAKRMLEYHKQVLKGWPQRKNIHFGISISTKAEADEKIPILLQIPAAVRWVSIEPMLGEIDFREETITVGKSRRNSSKISYPLLKQLNWVVIGAESKGGYAGRECKLEDVRGVVRQCDAAGVPVHVKQLHIDGKLEKDINKFPPDLRRRELPND